MIGAAAFARRLERRARAPIAVGFSGGGDSLAALLAAKAFADGCGRALIVLTVDHRLQPAAAAWTAFAGRTAARLGAEFCALSWVGEKPQHGLAAAARAARHQLLAQAARRAGARVIILGHTADDVLEADLMRAEGSTLGRLREWAPSPVWPEGREIFLLRPLLGERRAAIRAWLSARGERWIEDPANVDLGQARARARLALDGGGAIAPPACDDAAARLADRVVAVAGGALALARSALAAASPASARRVLAAAALSVGGGARPPRGARLVAALARLTSPGPVQANLCGARLIGVDDVALIVRDAGQAARGGLAPAALPCGEPRVWDGRFELRGDRPGLTVRALAGLAARLEPAQRRLLREVPAPARPALPALVQADGRVTCPILAGNSGLARDLVHDRMRAACGAIMKEPAT